MAILVYWLPLAAFVGCIVLALVIERRVAELIARIDEEKQMLAAVDMAIIVLSQRNRDMAEAVELLDYGAREEAIDLLRRWGEVRIGSAP